MLIFAHELGHLLASLLIDPGCIKRWKIYIKFFHDNRFYVILSYSNVATSDLNTSFIFCAGYLFSSSIIALFYMWKKNIVLLLSLNEIFHIYLDFITEYGDTYFVYFYSHNVLLFMIWLFYISFLNIFIISIIIIKYVGRIKIQMRIESEAIHV